MRSKLGRRFWVFDAKIESALSSPNAGATSNIGPVSWGLSKRDPERSRRRESVAETPQEVE